MIQNDNIKWPWYYASVQQGKLQASNVAEDNEKLVSISDEMKLYLKLDDLEDISSVKELSEKIFQKFSEDPSVATWDEIWQLAGNVSYRIRWYFTHLVEEKALETASFKEKLITIFSQKLSCGLQKEFSELSKRSQATHADLENDWKQTPDKLNVLFSGRGMMLMSSRFDQWDFQGTVWLFSRLDPQRFLKVCEEQIKTPIVFKYILEETRIFDKEFSFWKKLIENAPIAFKEDGTWTGSFFLPFLLRATLEACKYRIHGVRQEPEEEEEKNRLEVSKKVVESLKERHDYQGLIVRWSSWLLYEMTKEVGRCNKKSWPEDIRDQGYVEKLFISALDKAEPIEALPKEPPFSDVETWEYFWWFASNLAPTVLTGKTLQNPLLFEKPLKYLKEVWQKGSADWYGKSGLTLRQLVDSIWVSQGAYKEGPLVDSLGFTFFGIVMGWLYGKFQWPKFWIMSAPLRLSYLNRKKDAEQIGSQYPSAQILDVLAAQFSIGRRIFLDFLDKARGNPDNLEVKKQCSALFLALVNAAWEGRQSNHFLGTGKEFWMRSLAELAIFRVTWLNKDWTNGDKVGIDFSKEELPPIEAFISAASGNVEDILHIFNLLSLNKIPNNEIQNYFQKANLDTEEMYKAAVEILKTDEKRKRSKIQRETLLMFRRCFL